MRDAVAQKAITEKTLSAFQRNQQIRQAALSPTDDGNELRRLLVDLTPVADIRFFAHAEERHYKDGQGREIYTFVLYPQSHTLPPDVAFITYLTEHPTFNTTLMVAGSDRRFCVEYTGWGCLNSITAVIEYTTPTKPLAVSDFNMCAALGWK
jgi:hypothetical protein